MDLDRGCRVLGSFGASDMIQLGSEIAPVTFFV